jgi:hypothetical protein
LKTGMDSALHQFLLQITTELEIIDRWKKSISLNTHPVESWIAIYPSITFFFRLSRPDDSFK